MFPQGAEKVQRFYLLDLPRKAEGTGFEPANRPRLEAYQTSAHDH